VALADSLQLRTVAEGIEEARSGRRFARVAARMARDPTGRVALAPSRCSAWDLSTELVATRQSAYTTIGVREQRYWRSTV